VSNFGYTKKDDGKEQYCYFRQECVISANAACAAFYGGVSMDDRYIHITAAADLLLLPVDF
jgi:hypothetical protein